MTLLDIELVGATTRMRAELPDDVAVEHLITSMATLVGDASPADGPWLAYRPGGDRLPGGSTLAEERIVAGDVIYVARATPAIDDSANDVGCDPLDDLTPSQRAAAIVPERQSRARRVYDTLRALIGTQSLLETIDGTAFQRAASMWQWGDHRRRLEWMIDRPKLTRTVIIGVCSQAESGASARLSIDLATSLARARTDRVMIVDGEPRRAAVTRLTAGPSHSIAAVADGSTTVDARFGTGPLTVLGCDLSGTDIPDFDTYRRMLDRVRRNAGVVVIDCGPVGSRLTDLCEQIVLVTDTPVDRRLRQRLGRRPTVIAFDRRDHIAVETIDASLASAMGLIEMSDELSAPEINAVLADGWIRRGACS